MERFDSELRSGNPCAHYCPGQVIGDGPDARCAWLNRDCASFWRGHAAEELNDLWQDGEEPEDLLYACRLNWLLDLLSQDTQPWRRAVDI
jgi:hypothetical protein